MGERFVVPPLVKAALLVALVLLMVAAVGAWALTLQAARESSMPVLFAAR